MRSERAERISSLEAAHASRDTLWMRNLTWHVVLLLLVASGIPVEAQGHWNQWRGDVVRSALAALPGDLDVVGMRWTIATGGSPTGAALHDLNGDGSSDLITVEGGRLVARTLVGGVIWDTPGLQARRVVAMDDLNADGVMELVVDATTGVVLLDAGSGAVRWTSASELPIENLGGVQLANVDGDSALELFLADRAMDGSKPHLTGTIYRFDFEAGFGENLPTLATAADTRDYEAGVTFALSDVDADGVSEVVVAGWRHVYLYDVVTGALKGSSDDLTPVLGDENLVQGEWFVSDMGGDPGDEVALATNNVFVGVPSRRMLVWTWDGEKLALRWTRSADNPETDVHRWPPDQPIRLVGDGSQLVSSFWSPEEAWQTEVLNPWTGAVVAELVGEIGVGSFDRGPELNPALVSIATDLRDPASHSPSRFTDWDENGEGSLLATFDGSVHFLPGDVANQLVVLRDDDEDGWGDALALVSWPEGTPLAPEISDERIGSVIPVDVGGEPGVMALHASGEVALFDMSLVLRNDIDGDGHGDLAFEGHGVSRVGAWDGAPPLLVFPQSGGRITVVNASTGDPTAPPEELLTLFGNIAQHPVFLAGPEGPRVPVFSLDLERRLCVQFFDMNGQGGALTVLGGPGGVYPIVGDPLVLDANGDDVEDLVLIVRDLSQSEVHRVLAVDGTGGILWPGVDLPTPGGNVGSLAQSAEGDSILIVANKTLWSLDSATGAPMEVFVSPVGHWYGIPVAVDLNGDGTLETMFLGTSKGVAAFNADWSSRWVHEPGNSTRASGAWVQTESGVIVAASQQYSARLDLLEGATGTLLMSRWLFQGKVSDTPPPEGILASPIQEVLAMDPLDSTGEPGFLVTSASGHLHALGTDGEGRWSLEVGGKPGAPAVFDADGDGLAELAVPTSAGQVVGVDRGQLEPPAWVRENAGEGPALSDSEDLDVQEDCANVAVNWAEVPGATGYVVTLISEFGTVLASTSVLADSLEWTFQGLELPLGTLPHVDVSGIQVTPQVVIEGSAQSSDGVLIADLAPPELLFWEASLATMTVGESGEVNVLSAAAVDAKSIADWEVEIRMESGEPVRTFTGIVGAPEMTLELTWNGTSSAGDWVETGTYLAHLTVRDVAGSSVSDALPILVCGPPFVRDETKGACVDPSARVDLRDREEETREESGDEIREEPTSGSISPSGGGGCRNTTARRGDPLFPGLCLFLIGGGLLWARRETSQQRRF